MHWEGFILSEGEERVSCVFHDEVHVVLVRADVIEFDDVRMMEGKVHFYFGEELWGDFFLANRLLGVETARLLLQNQVDEGEGSHAHTANSIEEGLFRRLSYHWFFFLQGPL